MTRFEMVVAERIRTLKIVKRALSHGGGCPCRPMLLADFADDTTRSILIPGRDAILDATATMRAAAREPLTFLSVCADAFCADVPASVALGDEADGLARQRYEELDPGAWLALVSWTADAETGEVRSLEQRYHYDDQGIPTWDGDPVERPADPIFDPTSRLLVEAVGR